MNTDDRLDDLLSRWEGLAADGRPVAPAELCADCPELLPALEQAIAQCQRVRALAAAGTPDPKAETVAPEAADPTPSSTGGPAGSVPAAVGAYRVTRLPGEGGMGRVLAAVDPVLDRPVAVKLMHPHVAALPGARERFLREARSAAALRHDHAAPIYHVGEDAGVPFLVMPLLEGESLEARLRRERALPPAEAARIGREAALGLAAAHAKNLVHRDVKPANLWLEAPAGRVQVLDFGLARAADAADEVTAPGAVLGTPAYMAPEQARGEKVDHRCDLYALGCVLYRMTTGRLPFVGDSAYAVLNALATQAPRPVRDLAPAVPPALAALTEALLAKDPAARPGSAREVADRLAAIGREQAEPTRTLSPAVGKPGRGGRRRAGVLAALVAAAALVPLAYLYGGTVIRFATNTGEVVIETDGPDVEVTIKDGTAVVHDKVKDRRFVLTPGEYELEAREDGPDGVRFGTKKFTLTRGGKAVITARLEAVAKKPEIKLDPDPKAAARAVDADRKAAEWALSLGGGGITVRVGGEDRYVPAAGGALPSGPFRLVGINHEFMPITDDHLRNLRGLAHLEHLLLNYSQVGDAGLKHLAGLPKLAVLGLSGTRVTDAGLDHLARMPSLHTLVLDDTHVGDAGLRRLGGSRTLAQLFLSGTRVTDAGLADLEGLPALEGVNLGGTRITDAGLDRVVRCRGLSALGVVDTAVSDAGLARLRALPGLTLLYLDGTHLTDIGVGHLAGLPRLSDLHLRGLTVGDVELSRLKAVPKLRHLDIRFTRVTDDGLRHLKNVPGLRGLALFATGLTDAGVDHLSALRGLVVCDLRSTLVTPAGADRLRAAHPGCRVVWEGGDGSEDGRRAAEWALALGGTVKIVSVRVHQTIKAAADLPAVPFFVDEVNLRGNRRVSDADLAVPPSLWRLNLSGTAVGDGGVARLKHLQALRVLDLSGTKVTNAGLAHVGALPNLAELSLSNTAVTDPGLAHLRGLTHLRELDLTGTAVTPQAADDLRKALPKCRVTTGPSGR